MSFLLRGVWILRDVVRILCIFLFFFFFRYIYLLYMGLVTILTYIVLIFLYIDVCFSPTLTCVVSFLSLCICFLLIVCNILFLFHTKML